ncbi:MAG: hypothetical protein IIC36_15020 [Gemmatimonadetes bacterium]|nr:hypothetical protein [Gemmatimonadota bacterium]
MNAIARPSSSIGAWRRTLASGLFVALLVPTGVWAQDAEIQRLPSGRPDMNGIWQALGNHHWNIEAHAARAGIAMRPGPVDSVPAAGVLALGTIASVPQGWGIVEGGEIPYLPDALERRNENREHYLLGGENDLRLNRLEGDPVIRCYLPGVPRATYMPFPFQIFQSESHFFLSYEYAGAVRNVHLQNPGPAEVDSWMGQSVGHWEGDTFVVEVTGLLGQAWLDRAGNHHSYAMTVVERYTMMGPNHIQYEATMEDPNTFSRPWTIRLPLYRHVDPNARLGQFKCVPFVEELLYGQLRKTLVEPVR